MQLTWIKCPNGQWCGLYTVDLNGPHFERLQGAYVIWHGGGQPKTVRVGQGLIRDRLAAHRANPAIHRYASLGLFATWAAVAEASRDGVEAFLAAQLQPLVGERFPDRVPIPVNLPW
jgi:hypothetical protein